MALQNGDDHLSITSMPEETTSDDEYFEKLFLVDGVLDTLKSPLLISDFSQECIDDLFRMKEKADANVLAGIKQILGLDISDITKVKSVFETPRFFNDVLESCELEVTKDLNNKCDNVSDKDETEVSDKQTGLSDSVPRLPEACSIKLGHNDLNQEACEKAVPFLDYDDEIYNIMRGEEIKFSPIDPASVTPSGVFKLIDVRKYVFQSKFCQSCLSNDKDVFRFDEETDKCKENKALSRSYLKLNKISMASKKVYSKKSLPTSKDNPPSLILSPDFTESSNDSGMFQAYKSDKQIVNTADNTSLDTELNLDVKSLEEQQEEVQLSVQDSILEENSVIKDLESKLETSAGNTIEELVADIHISKDKVPSRKVFFTEKKQFKAILKADKKKNKKLKKRKEKRKASIHLSPPPGVDIDEYLQQQLHLIKAQLKSQNDVEKDLIDKNDIMNVANYKQFKGHVHENNICESSPAKNCSNQKLEETLKSGSPINISNRSSPGSMSLQLHRKGTIDGRFIRNSDALSSKKSTSSSPILKSPNQKYISGSSVSESPRHRSFSGSPTGRSVSGSPRRRSVSGSPRRRSASVSPRRRSASVSPRRRSGSPWQRSASGSPRKRSVSGSPRRKFISRSPGRSPRKRSPGSPRKSYRSRRRSPSPRYYRSRSRYQNNDFRRRQRSRSVSPRKFRSPNRSRYRNYERSRLALRSKRSRSRSISRKISSGEIRTTQRYIKSPLKSRISYKSRVIQVERTTSRYRYIRRSSRSPSPKDRKNKYRSSSPYKHGRLDSKSSNIERVAISTILKQYDRFDEVSLSSFSSSDGHIFPAPFSDYYNNQPAIEMNQPLVQDLVVADKDHFSNYYINNQPVREVNESANQDLPETNLSSYPT